MAFYDEVHATQKFRLGTRVKDRGGNEYIYLSGASSVADGDFVTFDDEYGVTLADSDGPTTGPVAVAKAAVDSTSEYGWFLIWGKDSAANVATHSSGENKALFISSTAGRATITPATERYICGAFSGADAASNSGAVFVSYPCVLGDIST